VKVDDVFNAIVTRTEAYGVYLVCEGVEILVLVTEIGYEGGINPRTRYQRGDVVRVKLMRHVPSQNRWCASIREAV